MLLQKPRTKRSSPRPALTLDRDGGLPLRRQIADGIRAWVRDGRVRPGDQLPTVRDLAAALGVDRNTVASAYGDLARDGLVEGGARAGTRVRPPAATTPGTTPAPRASETPAEPHAEVQRVLAAGLERPGVISLVGGRADPQLFFSPPVRAALRRAVREGDAGLLDYGPAAGDPELREELRRRLAAQDIATGAEDTVIVSGSQQGFDLVLRLLTREGDVVALEEPCYQGAASLVRAHRLRALPVPIDAEGMDPAELERRGAATPPRLIYVTPSFQNPTGALMGRPRREALLRAARRLGATILEDSCFHELRYESRVAPPLRALPGGEDGILLGSFSKSLFPGLRVGWVTAPTPIARDLAQLKRAADLGTGTLVQRLVLELLKGGVLEKQLRRVRPIYRARRDGMLAALRRHLPAGVRWTEPKGGLVLWVALPRGRGSMELFRRAAAEGVLTSPGALFDTEGRDLDGLRLSFASAGPREVEQGVRKLAALIQEPRNENPRRRAAEVAALL